MSVFAQLAYLMRVLRKKVYFKLIAFRHDDIDMSPMIRLACTGTPVTVILAGLASCQHVILASDIDMDSADGQQHQWTS